MFEYTSEVFAVGLKGFAEVDNERITDLAAEGWEPTLMSTVHNGFAAVVLFRREAAPGRRAVATPRPGASRVRKVSAPAPAKSKAKPEAKATRPTARVSGTARPARRLRDR